MSLTHDDQAALLLAADLCARYDRPGLAARLRRLALAPREAAQQPAVPPPEPESPRRQRPVRPGDDMAAVALVIRQLGDDDIYSLFLEAQRVRPSRLTGLVWRRAEQAQRRPQSNT